MIKVLQIVNANFGYDGISMVAKSYYRYIDKRIFKVDFLVINHGDLNFENEVKSNGDSFFCLEMRNKNPLKYMHELGRILQKGSYDIVHVHGNSATMFFDLFPAKLKNIRCRIAHSHNTKCDHTGIHKIIYPLFKRTYTCGFACSRDAGEFLFQDKDFFVMNNGIDCKRYRYNEIVRNKIRKEYNLSDKVVIGNIGRLTYQKNQEFLLSILGNLPDKYMLMLVGDGVNRSYLENMCNTLNLADRVLFLGNIDNVNEILQAMDLFAFPSRYEGLGIAAIEAQASNLPCILSSAVPSEVGIISTTQYLPINDQDLWVDTIKKYKVNIDNRELYADNACDLVVKAGYDIAQSVSKLSEIYKNLVG